MDALLRVAGLVKGYGEGSAHVDVLRGIDISLAQGELCALLGPSGSGKPTFLDLIGGLERADAGSMLVDGTDFTSLSDRALGEYRRCALGFVFQFYNLVEDLTIRENIEVCQYLAEDPLDVDGLLWSLGLWDQRDKFTPQVSGGQQQRCSIGRAGEEAAAPALRRAERRPRLRDLQGDSCPDRGCLPQIWLHDRDRHP